MVASKPGFRIMSRRLVLAAAVFALVGITATALSQQLPAPPVPTDPGALLPGVPQQVTVRVGDSVVVDGVPVGCQVTNRGGQVVIECGRTGDHLARTYMTIVGRRTVKVARLRSATSATTILTAQHGGGWRACGMPARAARSGGQGCR
jgi:hypothetical protein